MNRRINGCSLLLMLLCLECFTFPRAAQLADPDVSGSITSSRRSKEGITRIASASEMPGPRDPKPLIKESPKRVRISDNPLVNPASSKPLPSLPRALYSAPRTEKEIGDSGWQKARWSHYTLRVSGAANKSLSIATPSVVMLKASWHNKTEITFSLIKNGTTIASAKSGIRFDKSRLATIHAKVPSAGNLVIRAANSTSTPAAVDLYVGILTVSEK